MILAGVDNGHITSITKLSISKFIKPRLNIGWSLIFNLGIVEHRLTTYVRLKNEFFDTGNSYIMIMF